MCPHRNPTKYTLETMEHHMADIIQDTMYKILDNGDRPDKRIDAIIGLHYARVTILKRLDTLNQSITESS